RMTLGEVARVLAGAKVVVSVDTGLSHLNAALDRPNITLYGPTDPGVIGGDGKNQYTQLSHSGKLQERDASFVNVSLV
ncbi:glycosyltransferase family 9 protein, partial [Citrobacter braakii]|uniref:glycosyltransferase family 9 protein n=1 Tax=Citrobacter braakii TaxID=57706 RepID=UPI002B25519A